MKEQYIIYLAKCPKNKYYVGITSVSLDLRIKWHFNNLKNSKTKFSKILRKFKNRIKFKCLKKVHSLNEACKYEKFYIKKYNSYKNGYNSTIGGMGTTKLTNKEILESAKLYQTKSEWSLKNKSTYNAAVNRNIFNECIKHMKSYKYKYTDNFILNNAKKFKYIKDWKKEQKPLYDAASRRNLLKDATKHMIRLIKQYTNEELKQIAKKYTRVVDWLKYDINSYQVARSRKLLKICTKHMKKYQRNIL